MNQNNHHQSQLAMFSCFRRPGAADQPSDVELPLLRDDPCIFCKMIIDHGNEVTKIVEKAKNRPRIDTEKFFTTPICSMKTPTGEKPLSINDVELMYEKDFPNWKEELQCFPEAPIFYDKLFKKSPNKRAIDIEKSTQELKNKIEAISEAPFDVEKDGDDAIVTKALDNIVQNLQPLIKHLKLEEDPRIKNGLPKVIKGKLTSNVKQLRDVTQVVSTLHELQLDGFYLVMDNNKAFREEHGYYKMRSVS